MCIKIKKPQKGVISKESSSVKRSVVKKRKEKKSKALVPRNKSKEKGAENMVVNKTQTTKTITPEKIVPIVKQKQLSNENCVVNAPPKPPETVPTVETKEEKKTGTTTENRKKDSRTTNKETDERVTMEVFENAQAQTFIPINITQIFSQIQGGSRENIGDRRSDINNDDTLVGIDVDIFEIILPELDDDKSEECPRYPPKDEITCTESTEETPQSPRNREHGNPERKSDNNAASVNSYSNLKYCNTQSCTSTIVSQITQSPPHSLINIRLNRALASLPTPMSLIGPMGKAATVAESNIGDSTQGTTMHTVRASTVHRITQPHHFGVQGGNHLRVKQCKDNNGRRPKEIKTQKTVSAESVNGPGMLKATNDAKFLSP